MADLMDICKERIGPLAALAPFRAVDGELQQADGRPVCRFFCTIGKAEYEWARCEQIAEALNEWAAARGEGDTA